MKLFSIHRFLALVQSPIVDFSLPSGLITYNEMLIDSPDFNSTTGVYTIPQTGVYLFTFDGFVYGTCRHGFIRFYINGRDSGHIIEQNTDGQSSRGISGMRAMYLEQYEMVSLSNDNDDCIFGDDMHPFLFTGSYFGTRS